MRFLADENFDLAIIQALRAAGHDVAAIGETDSGAPDELVIELALKANRVLLTEDKDFGDLVYNRALPSPGVILIRRFPRSSGRAKSNAVVEAAKSLGDTLGDRFVVVEPGRVRVGGRSRG